MRFAGGARPSLGRLVWSELCRHVLGWRSWLVVAAFVTLGLYRLLPYWPGPPRPLWDGLRGSLSLGGVAAATLVAGSSFAELRKTRFARLMLLRGYTRRSYAAANALATAASTALVTGVASLGCIAAAWWQPETWLPPGRSDLLPLAMLVAAAAGMSLTGFLAGAIAPSPQVASAAPPVVMIVAAFLLRKSPFSPLTQLEAWRSVVHASPPALPVPGTFLYWAAVAAFTSLLAIEIYARSERD